MDIAFGRGLTVGKEREGEERKLWLVHCGGPFMLLLQLVGNLAEVLTFLSSLFMLFPPSVPLSQNNAR
jgi:hypothetical protein